MGFFQSIFGKGNHQYSENPHNGEKSVSPESSNTNILDGDSSAFERETPKKYVTLSAATGYPIDAIYEFVLRDLEEQGYNDALSNPDITYCKQAESILKNKLDLLFERVTLIYQENMRKIEMRTRLANDALIYSTVASLSASLETLKEHMNKISEMQKKAKSGDETFLNMIASYRRGFTNGLSASCEKLLNDNYNIITLSKNENSK